MPREKAGAAWPTLFPFGTARVEKPVSAPHRSMATDVASAHDISDPSEASADHIPVKKLTIGSWNLLAKYDEHVLLSFYWAERKLVWEVLHLGVVRKMEVDFEDLAQATLTSGAEEAPDKLVIELLRPPRFFKENPPSAVAGAPAGLVSAERSSLK